MKSKRRILVCMVVLVMCMMVGCKTEAQKKQEAYRTKGIACMTTGDYEKAVKYFQKALDQSVGEIGVIENDICFYKAAAEVAMGDYASAMDSYNALCEYDESNGDYLYLRGNLYLKMDKIEKAMKDYDAALKRAGEDYKMYRNIYDNLLHAEYKDEAVGYLQKAVEYSAKSPEAYAEQGYIYYLMGDYSQAKRYLDKAIDKDSKEALLYLAEVYNATDQTEQAQAMLENYVNNHEGDSEALNALGMMQMEREDYESALKYFQLGLKVENPENKQELMRNEIIAYECLRDFQSAKKKMKTYLKEYPDDIEAMREYTFLKTR